MTELKETSIERIVGDDYCCVYTAEQKFINKLYKLQQDHPEVEIKAVNEDGSILAHVPFNWFRFVSPPKKMNFSEEHLEKLRERGKKLGEKNVE